MSQRLEHLDPELILTVPISVFNALVDVVNTLCDSVDLYEAHTENLIERMRALEIFTDYDASLEPETGDIRGSWDDLAT